MTIADQLRCPPLSPQERWISEGPHACSVAMAVMGVADVGVCVLQLPVPMLMAPRAA